MTEPKTEDPMVAALLRERAGYVQRGMDDRIAQVDEQLSLRGYTDPAEQSGQSGEQTGQEPGAGRRAAKTSARQAPPKGRRAPRTDTT
jgi:hypothetical protein